MTFGAMVKSRRQELQMTQQELAKKVGIHRTTIIGYEKGMMPEDIKIRRALCSALGFTFKRLFGENDELEMMREPDEKVERELLMNFAGLNGCVVFLNDVVLEGIEKMADFILQTDDLAEDSRLAVVNLKRKIECECRDRERKTAKNKCCTNGREIKQLGGVRLRSLDTNPVKQVNFAWSSWGVFCIMVVWLSGFLSGHCLFDKTNL